MTVKDPIKSNIVGPAQTTEEKAYLFLYLAKDNLRKDPSYSREMIENAKWLYSHNNLPVPEDIKIKINELENMLKG